VIKVAISAPHRPNDSSNRLLGRACGQFCQEPFKIKRSRIHHELAGLVSRPLASRPVPVEFQTVSVGVAQVERLADAVIGRTVQADAVIEEAPECAR